MRWLIENPAASLCDFKRLRARYRYRAPPPPRRASRRRRRRGPSAPASRRTRRRTADRRACRASVREIGAADDDLPELAGFEMDAVGLTGEAVSTPDRMKASALMSRSACPTGFRRPPLRHRPRGKSLDARPSSGPRPTAPGPPFRGRRSASRWPRGSRARPEVERGSARRTPRRQLRPHGCRGRRRPRSVRAAWRPDPAGSAHSAAQVPATAMVRPTVSRSTRSS